MVNMMQKTKDEARAAMVAELDAVTQFGNAASALWAIFGEGWEPGGIPFFEAALLRCAAEGKDALATNDTAVWFPDELVESYGGVEAQYGIIEMGNLSFPDDEGIDQVPFDEAFRLIEIAAKHYVSYRPDRADEVSKLLSEGRKSFDNLIARHEAWKKINPTG